MSEVALFPSVAITLKKVSESRRQQNVYRYFVPGLIGVDLTTELDGSNARLPPLNHIPRPSIDAGLTAFAQLGAIRLGASRALISLIDGHRQYILAEATPTLSLREGSKETGTNRLWLGNVSIPKSKGVCQTVLELGTNNQSRTERENHSSAVVIDDLLQHESFGSEWFIKDGPKIRFYAGVPLIVADGSTIGALCIFDHVPRKGLSLEDLVIMQDLAATVIQHLSTYKFERDLRRGERMVRGLTSFIEGARSLQPAVSPDVSPPRSPKIEKGGVARSQLTTSMEVPLGEPSGEMIAALSETNAVAGHKQSGPKTDSIRISTEPERKLGLPGQNKNSTSLEDAGQMSQASAAQNELPHPQDSLLPMGAKLMFSRAANIIRETSDLDGVVVFDASVAANRLRLSTTRRAPPALHRESSGRTEDSESSVGSPQPQDKRYAYIEPSQTTEWLSDVQKPRRKMSHILCFADGNSQSVAGDSAVSSYQSLAESDLKKVLDRYPKGKVINFDAYGNASSTEDSDNGLSEGTKVDVNSKSASHAKRKKSISEAIQAVAPGSRSVALLPLWDYERARWFAVCLFWTSNPHRILSQLDLTYFRAFGNTVMTELSRLDAINSNNTKTTFVASISHELRSPLHGILGGVEFMQGSILNAFQASMLNSIEMCGKTLLDTVDHVLDWSKINELTKSMTRPSTRARKRGSKRSLVSPLHSKTNDSGPTSLTSSLNLALSAEEVVEAVFSGMSYRVTSTRIDDSPKSSLTPKDVTDHLKHHTDANRKKVFVLLEISQRASWSFNTQPGAWRRIVMNIFGNALKYTESGFIRVSLTAQEVTYGQESADADDSSGTRSSGDSQYSPETRVTLSVTDSGIGISEDYLANKIYTPFSQENSFYAGTGLGLSIVRQLVESLGGSINVKSQHRVGTEVRVKLTLPSSGVTSIPEEDDVDPITALAIRIQGKRICVLDSSAGTPEYYQLSSSTNPTTVSLGPSLVASLKDWFGVEVTLSEQFDKHEFDIVILTDISFDYLSTIRSRRQADQKTPIVIFIALDAIEASSVRNDSRILDNEVAVEIITQPCGPYKLAKALNHCLDRYEADVVSTALRPAENLPMRNVRPKRSESPLSRGVSPWPYLEAESVDHPYVLIVDDNTINRRLLIAFMKRNNYAYKEAVNGLEAVQAFIATPRPFDVVLMDLSMPVMDGNSATREIRHYEKQRHLKPTKIIALTGLASTSARIEALSSGADQFLTKPIRFQVLMPLLESSAELSKEDPAKINHTH